jgi:hypothetical protein
MEHLIHAPGTERMRRWFDAIVSPGSGIAFVTGFGLWFGGRESGTQTE